MYCTVYTNGNGSVIYINPNCNMKLIYEYLRVVTEVPDSKEIDLCTENGRLMGIYEAPCSTNGLQYFQPRLNYFVVTFDYVEGSGELYNPQSLMHYTNRDFESVFAKIKKTFGIPPSETIDDSDALLIFEHLLQAYQENPRLFFESPLERASSSVRRPDTKKKRSQSNTSLKARSSKQSVGTSVLALWREEKKAKMAAQIRMEESEVMVTKRGSSVIKSGVDVLRMGESDNHEWEEANPEERPTELIVNSNKSKDDQSQTIAKKGSKKQQKKSGKDVKEDAKLLQAAAPYDSGLLPTPKPSLKYLQAESQLPLHPSAVKSSGDDLETIFKSKSSLYAKSDLHDPTEPSTRRPNDSIRQFFRNHPTDKMDLPKPPAVGSSFNVKEGTTKIRKNKKLAGLKRKKVVISRKSHTMMTRTNLKHK